MLMHQEIWQALDIIADKYAVRPSALARMAGLDPTTFNKSKRFSPDGKPRWPSTESLAKVLNTLGVSFADFAALTATSVAGADIKVKRAQIPVTQLSQAGTGNLFDKTGQPVGEYWDSMHIPDIRDEHVFALQVSGDEYAPLIRRGTHVMISPQAQIRRGDRIAVNTDMNVILFKEFEKMSTQRAMLRSLHPDRPASNIPLTNIRWMARIVWISQ